MWAAARERNQRERIGLTLAALALYAIAFLPVLAFLGPVAASLYVLPLVVGGLALGVRGGVGTLALYLPLSAALLVASRRDPLGLFTQGHWLILVPFVAVALAVGRLSDVSRASAKQAADLERERANVMRELTLRRNAEANAARAHAAVTSAYERMTDAFFAVDREWRFVYLNAVAARMRRTSWEAVKGKVIWDEFPDLKGSAFEREYRLAMSEGVPVRVEQYYPRMDRWFEATAYPSADGLSVFFRDVTARKKADATATDLASLVQSATDAVISVSPDGRVRSWNPGAERLYGWTESEMLGQSMSRLYLEGEAVIEDSLASVATIGDHHAHEGRRRRKDGTLVDVSVSLSAIRDAQGGLVGYAGITHDITARKRAEQAQAQLATLVTHSDDAIAGLTPEGIVTSWNPAAERLYGYEARDIVGRDTLVLAPDLLASEERGLIERARAGNTVRGFDTERVRADGARVAVTLSYSPVRDEAGAVTGVVMLARDVSDRRRAEEDRLAGIERLKELERLKEVDRFKTQFINTAAHELGTPLTPIKLQLHLLKNGRGMTLNADERKTIDILDRNVDRLMELVRDVLDGARLQASRLGVNHHPIDLARVVSEAVESFQPSAHQSKLALEASIPRDLPVSGDAQRLTQVMFNLLSNAVKFTPMGGRITVQAERTPEAAVVRVTDTGAGLSPSQIERLFQPFSQVHNTAEWTRPGTGLGLYISKGILELHQGSITVESEGPGRGATFEFTLPLREA